MPNTTNFNFPTPADTDLVKDGALAIRNLGNAIDTAFVDLKGGTTGQVLSKNSNTDLDYTWVAADDTNAIQNAIIDAKGDLIVGTAADTPARLASSGSNGDLLTIDTSTASGLKWAAPASAGGMTLITTTTFNNTVSTYTYSSLGSYKHLLIVIDNINTNAGASISNLAMRMNGITSSDYHFSNWGFREAGTFSTYNGQNGLYALMRDLCPNSTQGTSERGVAEIWIYDYAGSTRKTFFGMGRAYGSAPTSSVLSGFLNTTNAITSVTILNEQGNNFNNGTLKLYGVS